MKVNMARANDNATLIHRADNEEYKCMWIWAFYHLFFFSWCLGVFFFFSSLKILSMESERFSVPEVLFNPSDVGIAQVCNLRLFRKLYAYLYSDDYYGLSARNIDKEPETISVPTDTFHIELYCNLVSRWSLHSTSTR